MNSKEKFLFAATVLLAAYNILEILVATSQSENQLNGYLDLLLPIVLIANLIWLIWRRNRMALISFLLCGVSILGVIVMLTSSGPFYEF